MIVIYTYSDLRVWLNTHKGKSIGFVPTMGALHQGHIQLVSNSLKDGNITIASIFVNPKQFNNSTDFEKYPKTIQADIEKLQKAGCHAVYIPDVNEIYPNEFKPVTYNLGYLDTVLEGSKRPGHFLGVIQILTIFFKQVKPNFAFFGLKDYQQCMVVKHLVERKFKKIHLKFGETLREDTGLAMSSRNMRLSKEGKLLAANIYKSLLKIKVNCNVQRVSDAIEESKLFLEENKIEVEYLTLANASTFQLVEEWQSKGCNIVLTAVYIEGVRLIDNLIF